MPSDKQMKYLPIEPELKLCVVSFWDSINSCSKLVCLLSSFQLWIKTYLKKCSTFLYDLTWDGLLGGFLITTICLVKFLIFANLMNYGLLILNLEYKKPLNLTKVTGNSADY